MKVIAITGAGTGIGRATAERFSSQGHRVILIGRNGARLEALSKTLKNSQVIPCDLSSEAETRKLGKKLVDLDIEVLINNAGTIERGEFEKSGSTTWRSQYEVNLFAPVWLTQEIIPHLYKKGNGCIINISSSLGVRPVAGTAAYSSSKAAMISWTKALALEAASHGVRVNVVCPGIVDTPILTGHTRALKPEESQHLGGLHPLGRLGRPEEIAEAIDFLSTSEWTTGSVLVIDGGISLTQK